MTPSSSTRSSPPVGSLWGSTALIAGTTVGAGILALPAVTLPAGLLPSMVVMLGVWLYMLVSGLLIARANILARAGRDGTETGLLATIADSLGKRSAIAAGTVYIFIHYALLVAYLARGGEILAAGLADLSHWLGYAGAIAPAFGSLMLTCLLGSVLYLISQRWLNRLNTLLIAGVLVSFIALVGLVIVELPPQGLQSWPTSENWTAASIAIPVVIVAFVFHNVIPVVTAELNGDSGRVNKAIVIGSLIPLGMFLLWNGVMLTCVGSRVTLTPNTIFDPLEMLRMAVAHPALGSLVAIFSELAIATSFIGFVLGLLSVYDDILPEGPLATQPFRYALVLFPPLGFSVVNPDIFFQALDWAGAYGNTVLFGIFPALMAWQYSLPAEKSVNEKVFEGFRTAALTVGMVMIAIAIICERLWLDLT